MVLLKREIKDHKIIMRGNANGERQNELKEEDINGKMELLEQDIHNKLQQGEHFFQRSNIKNNADAMHNKLQQDEHFFLRMNDKNNDNYMRMKYG